MQGAQVSTKEVFFKARTIKKIRPRVPQVDLEAMANRLDALVSPRESRDQPGAYQKGMQAVTDFELPSVPTGTDSLLEEHHLSPGKVKRNKTQIGQKRTTQAYISYTQPSEFKPDQSVDQRTVQSTRSSAVGGFRHSMTVASPKS
jgi:hypothetical protein